MPPPQEQQQHLPVWLHPGRVCICAAIGWSLALFAMSSIVPLVYHLGMPEVRQYINECGIERLDGIFTACAFPKFCYMNISSRINSCLDVLPNYGIDDGYILKHRIRNDMPSQFLNTKVPGVFVDTLSATLSNQLYVVAEYDIVTAAQESLNDSSITLANPGSLHEITPIDTYSDHTTIFLSSQLSDVLVKIKAYDELSGVRGVQDMIEVMQWWPLTHENPCPPSECTWCKGYNATSYPPDTFAPTYGTQGLHKIMIAHRNPDPPNGASSIGWIALEFANQVAAIDLADGTIIKRFTIPLSCDGGRCETIDTAYDGLKPWNAVSCGNEWTDPGKGPSLARPVCLLADSNHTAAPSGSHPHMLVEDNGGNVWISLKIGGIARLSVDNATWYPSWFIVGVDTGSISFYIGTNVAGDAIWVNNINYGFVYLVNEPTAAFPQVQSLNLDTSQSLSAGCNSLPPIDLQYPRPGGFYVTAAGSIVLALYHPSGTIVQLNRDFERRDITIQDMRFIPDRLLSASLHLSACITTDGTFRMSVMTSAQDFVSGIGSASQDAILTFDVDDIENIEAIINPTRVFTAATENQWFHRNEWVMCDNVIATELLSDRVLYTFKYSESTTVIGGVGVGWNGRPPPYGTVNAN